MGEARYESDCAEWLALIHLPGVGAAGGRSLLDRFNTPRRLFEAGEEAWRETGLPETARRYLSQHEWQQAIEADLTWLRGPDRHFITYADATYPPLLREIADPPLALFIHGDPAQLLSPQIAIVGSRNPSPGGERTAEDFAAYLCGAGLTITSGLAVGIDAAAHRGALRHGHTLAVTGTGLDRVYPARHRELAHAIVDHGGALISEFPIGTPPRPDHFPRRNRLISGLSLGTLVVEANVQSGSLITARLAAEQGREVFAIPGSIHNPLARGCHALIRQGAKLVETGQDVLEELPGGLISPRAAPLSSNTAARAEKESTEVTKLLDSLGFEPTAIDSVVERSGLTADQVSSMLVVLELQGRVMSTPGGLYSRLS